MTDPEHNIEHITIPAGQSLSEGIDLTSSRLHRIEMPTAWDPASITLLAAGNADGDFLPVYLDTAEYVITSAAAGRAIVVDQALAFGVRHLMIRSGTSGAPVNQTAARRLTLVTAPL